MEVFIKDCPDKGNCLNEDRIEELELEVSRLERLRDSGFKDIREMAARNESLFKKNVALKESIEGFISLLPQAFITCRTGGTGPKIVMEFSRLDICQETYSELIKILEAKP